ncbi:hypothetical protein [Acidovorax sp. M2(2025)]|uniref:hypothetical protein n=1 Tax=Acidovorax sp. M2(2025) TaxID=3411355 RepID=UPI003BF5C194
MPLPFLVSCSISAPVLFERSDGRFQLMDQQAPAPFMAGRGYLLVEQALAAFLQNVEVERVSFRPAILFSPITKEEFSSHVRVRVSQFFRSSELLDLDVSGNRLLTLNDQYYFASPELKALLEASAFRYLEFSEGFSGFAASAA